MLVDELQASARRGRAVAAKALAEDRLADADRGPEPCREAPGVRVDTVGSALVGGMKDFTGAGDGDPGAPGP